MIAPADLEALRWLEPWELLPPERREVLEHELARELCPKHALSGRACVAVAARGDRDDVLFIVDCTWLAIVHLTWSTETDPAWPSTTFVQDVPAFVNEQMAQDHEGVVG